MLEALFADVNPKVARVIDAALAKQELSVEDCALLLESEGPDLHALLKAGDVARQQDNGDDVSFIVNRNINFTNICFVGCSFCGFSRHQDDHDAYDYDFSVMLDKARDAISRGATEVCIQGGIDPRKDHEHYLDLLRAFKAEFPDLHIHAYSPAEIDFAHRKSGLPLNEFLLALKDAGLDTIPGTASEILDDEIRNVIAPRKLMTDRWTEIIRTAHQVGFRTTSTVMYGHIENTMHVAKHLEIIRSLQKETGGFTEFVPLGFIHERNLLYRHLGSRPGSSTVEDLRIIAVARLFLRPWISNIQVSWVKMGPKLAQMGLLSGANDFGGTLMEESISRESGADHGENLPQEEIRRLVRELKRIPVERNTRYQTLRRFDDPALDPPSLEPKKLVEVAGPKRLRQKVSSVPTKQRAVS